MKMICYGVSASAFVDYHKFSESTARRCIHHLTKGLVTCPLLSGVYLRNASKADAHRVTGMHHHVHKMPGMLGSLDVTKVAWKNCPKYATIALESIVDYNLWFWHASFEFPGTLNDINIWERSSLLESMINEQHDMIDHEFCLNGVLFNKHLYLVDGIYRSLPRFLGLETDPATKLDGAFKIVQVSSCVDMLS
jgi:hypothetical protein